ncbi:hypothetical protein WDW86_15065 [Bdellovibrionota bacterium FG-2]
MKKLLLRLFFLPLLVTSWDAARADEFHYKDVLVGERASGMGGTFIAISDDPSGMFYNPAGIVFSMENYFSLSANAYSVSELKYKDIVVGQDYQYKSQGLVPAFFGFTQSIGKSKLGIAVIVPDSQLLDQDDTVTSLSTETDSANTLKRRLFRQDITYYGGPAFAREVFKNFTVGASLFGFARLDKSIDYQLILFNPVPTGKYFSQNTTQTRSFFGVSPKLGVQYMPISKLSLGLTVSRIFNLSGSGSGRIVRNKSTTDGKIATPTGSFDNDMEIQEIKLLHNMPEVLEIGLGTALFFTKTFLVTGDLTYRGTDPSYREIAGGMQSTTDFSLGSEYYLSESVAVRGGFFTNKAKTPALVEGGINQSPHVDLYGETVGISLYKPGSSLTLSGAYSRGKGTGQAIGDTAIVQPLEQSNATVYLTGSYQL